MDSGLIHPLHFVLEFLGFLLVFLMVIWGSGPIMSKSSLSMIKDASITAEPPQDQKIKVRLGGTHLCGLTFLSFSLYIMKLYGFTLIKGIWENDNFDLKLRER
jgi:hypothetical protein